MPSSGESSQPRVWTQVSYIADGFFTVWATKEAPSHPAKGYPHGGGWGGARDAERIQNIQKKSRSTPYK